MLTIPKRQRGKFFKFVLGYTLFASLLWLYCKRDTGKEDNWNIL